MSIYFNHVNFNRRSTLLKHERLKKLGKLPKTDQFLDVLKEFIDPKTFPNDEKQFYDSLRKGRKFGYLSENIDHYCEQEREETAFE